MRILQICQRPQRRGAEMFASQLSRRLRRDGHEVRTAYLYPHVDPGVLSLEPGDCLLDGEEHHPLETLIGVRPVLLRRLGELVREFRPAIIQVNGARTLKYGVLARRLYGDAEGAVVYRNIGTVDDWVRGPRRKAFYRLIFRNLDGVVAISRDSLRRLGPELARHTPRTVISNAVDPDALEPLLERERLRASACTPPEAPVALFVGSLAPEKRVDRLIDAAKRVRDEGLDLRLWIVGDGPLRAELEEGVRRVALDDAVRFFGARDDVASCLAAADFVVLASDTEGVPGTLLEAGWMGLPVVSTRVGAVEECVTHEQTGLLVEAGDGEALAGAMGRLAGDPTLRARLGARGHEAIAADHTIEHIAQHFLDFYRVVARGAGAIALGPGMRLLALLTRPVLDRETAARARALGEAEVDWDAFPALCLRHRLVPLVSLHLDALGGAVPAEAAERLRRLQLTNTFHVLDRTGQLLEVLEAFRRRGIVGVPYKGPALGAQLYGSGALRHAGDLDIVVRPRQVAEARRVLGSLGYEARIPLDDRAVRFMVRHRYHEEYAAPGDRPRAPVELHWAFANRDFPFALDLEEAVARTSSVPLGGHEVPTFHPEDLLPILCVHGAKHRWERLEWIAGVAELVRSAEIDWDRVLRRASRLGVRRTLFLGLALATDLLAAPLPPEVLRRVQADRDVALLARECMELLGREPAGWEVAELLQRDGFRLRLRERWRDRARSVWHRATTPSDPDRWDVVGIGPWLLPVHAFRRPFHVVRQLASAIRLLLPSSP